MAFSEDEIDRIREDCLKDKDNPRALMILVAIETGLRAGELPALLKTDDLGDYLHVHRQQLKDKDDNGQIYYYDVSYTKDERLHPHNGRFVPITPACREALDLAKSLSGNNEHIFYNKKGLPIQRDSYAQSLHRRCVKLDTGPKHNHAFRVAFNSRMINLDIGAADRALILGHEVQTNETHYSVTDKRHLGDLRDRLLGNN